MRSSAHAADNGATQSSRFSAQLHADLAYLEGAVRHHVPLLVAAVLLIAAAWSAGRLLRRFYARRWLTRHLTLSLSSFSATDFTPQPVNRLRRRPAARARAHAQAKVVRVEIADRTTAASCLEAAL